jgi:hypothetical protein
MELREMLYSELTEQEPRIDITMINVQPNTNDRNNEDRP